MDITPYDDKKDRQFVMSLIDENPFFLSYEYAGKPAGTTEKFLTEKGHYTFVLRNNNVSIGFINFAVAAANMLPAWIFDGGKFFWITILGITKSEKVANIALKIATYAIFAVFILLMFYWAIAFR